MTLAPITRFTGLDVQGDPKGTLHAVYVPKYTTAEIAKIPAKELRNGGIVYNTTLRSYQLYETYVNAAGPGFTSGWINLTTVYSIPNAAAAAFEAAYTTPGTMYINAGDNTVKIHNGAAWVAITTA